MILTDKTWILSFQIKNNELIETNYYSLNPKFSKFPVYRIHIVGESNNFTGKPHFHITDNNNNVIVRVQILTNQYKREKNDKMRTLTSKTCKELEKFMHDISPINGLNNWQYICEKWNECNQKSLQIPEDAKQPNYTNILEDKK